MRTDDYKQSPYTPAVPDGEFGIAGNRVYEDGMLSHLLFDGGICVLQGLRPHIPLLH